MKKFRVTDAKGEKTFLSMSSIKRWYSVSLENAPDTNHSSDAFFYSHSYISFGKLRFCLYLSYVFVNDKAYKTSACFFLSDENGIGTKYIGTPGKAAAYVNKVHGKKCASAKDFEEVIENALSSKQKAKNHELFVQKYTAFKEDFENLMKKYNFEMDGDTYCEGSYDYADAFGTLQIVDKEYEETVDFIDIEQGGAEIRKD
jgi:uncharacterized protein YkuJ